MNDELNLYGYAHYLEKSRSRPPLDPEEGPLLTGRVLSHEGHSLKAITRKGIFHITIPGKLLQSAQPGELPVTGDWILLETVGTADQGLFHRLLPRYSLLQRREPGTTAGRQLLIANLDSLLILTSPDDDFSPNRILRFATLARNGGIRPVALLSKIDLAEDRDLYLEKLRRKLADTLILPISVLDGTGVDQVRSLIPPGHTAALAGSSGTGKSTLTNALLGGEFQKTTEVREGDSKGRHTTTSRDILLLPEGGLLADMPGVREVGLTGEREGLSESFARLEELAGSCRFSDCTHTMEPGCEVRRALDEGELLPETLEAYRSLKEESLRFEKNAGQGQKREDSKKRWKSIHKEIRRFKKYHDKRR